MTELVVQPTYTTWLGCQVSAYVKTYADGRVEEHIVLRTVT